MLVKENFSKKGKTLNQARRKKVTRIKRKKKRQEPMKMINLLQNKILIMKEFLRNQQTRKVGRKEEIQRRIRIVQLLPLREHLINLLLQEIVTRIENLLRIK